jgi:hypothetical protein
MEHWEKGRRTEIGIGIIAEVEVEVPLIISSIYSVVAVGYGGNDRVLYLAKRQSRKSSSWRLFSSGATSARNIPIGRLCNYGL